MLKECFVWGADGFAVLVSRWGIFLMYLIRILFILLLAGCIKTGETGPEPENPTDPLGPTPIPTTPPPPTPTPRPTPLADPEAPIIEDFVVELDEGEFLFLNIPVSDPQGDPIRLNLVEPLTNSFTAVGGFLLFDNDDNIVSDGITNQLVISSSLITEGGTFEVAYQATDGTHYSLIKTLFITVNLVDQQPRGESKSFTLTSAQDFTFSVQGSDRETPTENLLYHLVQGQGPDHAQNFSLNSQTGLVNYKSLPNFTGVDSFRFQIEDNAGQLSAQYTITFSMIGNIDPNWLVLNNGNSLTGEIGSRGALYSTYSSIITDLPSYDEHFAFTLLNQEQKRNIFRYNTATKKWEYKTLLGWKSEDLSALSMVSDNLTLSLDLQWIKNNTTDDIFGIISETPRAGTITSILDVHTDANPFKLTPDFDFYRFSNLDNVEQYHPRSYKTIAQSWSGSGGKGRYDTASGKTIALMIGQKGYNLNNKYFLQANRLKYSDGSWRNFHDPNYYIIDTDGDPNGTRDSAGWRSTTDTGSFSATYQDNATAIPPKLESQLKYTRPSLYNYPAIVSIPNKDEFILIYNYTPNRNNTADNPKKVLAAHYSTDTGWRHYSSGSWNLGHPDSLAVVIPTSSCDGPSGPRPLQPVRYGIDRDILRNSNTASSLENRRPVPFGEDGCDLQRTQSPIEYIPLDRQKKSLIFQQKAYFFIPVEGKTLLTTYDIARKKFSSSIFIDEQISHFDIAVDERNVLTFFYSQDDIIKYKELNPAVSPDWQDGLIYANSQTHPKVLNVTVKDGLPILFVSEETSQDFHEVFAYSRQDEIWNGQVTASLNTLPLAKKDLESLGGLEIAQWSTEVEFYDSEGSPIAPNPGDPPYINQYSRNYSGHLSFDHQGYLFYPKVNVSSIAIFPPQYLSGDFVTQKATSWGSGWGYFQLPTAVTPNPAANLVYITDKPAWHSGSSPKTGQLKTWTLSEKTLSFASRNPDIRSIQTPTTHSIRRSLHFPSDSTYSTLHNKLYVTHPLDNKISVYNTLNTNAPTYETSYPKATDTYELNFPQGIEIDASGNLYIVDGMNHRVVVLNSQGDFLYTFGSAGEAPGSLYYPYSLAIGGDFLYITEPYLSRVQVFKKDGTFINYFTHWESEGARYSPRGNTQFNGELRSLSGVAIHNGVLVIAADRQAASLQMPLWTSDTGATPSR